MPDVETIQRLFEALTSLKSEVDALVESLDRDNLRTFPDYLDKKARYVRQLVNELES